MIVLRNELRKNIFRTTFRVVFFSVCLFWTAFSAFAQTSPLPAPTAPVNDYANVIDDSTEQRLNGRLKKLQAEQKIEIAVVTVKTTGGQPIFDYSLAIARGWGIGSKEDDNPSLLLTVAIDDRKYFTQVSRDLEGDLPDGVTGQIQREKLVPAFRQSNYTQGINDTIETYISTLAQKRGFKFEGTAPVSAPTKRKTSQPSGKTVCCVVIIIIVVIIVLLIINKGSGGGRRGRSGGGGFGGIIPIPFPINTGGGGWGGDSGSSWGGGGGSSGGSDWGGFGGGGDFGGGGAGGDW